MAFLGPCSQLCSGDFEPQPGPDCKQSPGTLHVGIELKTFNTTRYMHCNQLSFIQTRAISHSEFWGLFLVMIAMPQFKECKAPGLCESEFILRRNTRDFISTNHPTEWPFNIRHLHYSNVAVAIWAINVIWLHPHGSPAWFNPCGLRKSNMDFAKQLEMITLFRDSLMEQSTLTEGIGRGVIKQISIIENCLHLTLLSGYLPRWKFQSARASLSQQFNTHYSILKICP
jgi:hypothetical protein